MVYEREGQKILIFNGDRIQTGRNSHVKISLKEQGDLIELQSFSFFKVAIGEENIDKMVLPVGKARFKVRKRTGLKKKRFRVKTGNALVGVKGTEWVMSSGEGDTAVLTISGTVSLASILAPEIAVDVTENQASKIEQNKPPTTPIVVPPQVRQQVLSSDSRKAFGNIKYGSVISVTKEQQEKIQKKAKQKEEKPAEGEKKESDTTKEGQENSEEKPAGQSGEGDQEGSDTESDGEVGSDEESPADDFAVMDFEEEEVEEPEIDIDDLIDDLAEIETEIVEEQAGVEIEAVEIQVQH